MNVRAGIMIDLEKNGKVYTLYLPYGAPYAEAHEVSLAFTETILELTKKAEELEKARKEEAETKSQEAQSSQAGE